MNIMATNNQHETSVTVLRENGVKVDFCHMENEIIVGETKGDEHHHIVLSIEEAQELQKHLTAVLD